MANKRSSNFELLRIVSMLLVLLLHSDFRSLHAPSSVEISELPVTSFFRFFVQSVSIISVDLFVLISGWFGIKARSNKFLGFMFQIVFYSFLGYLIAFVMGGLELDKKTLVLELWGTQNYWFVRAYIVLFCFSPILNVFIENCDKKKAGYTIIALWIVEVCFGWWYSNCNWYQNGYSPLSFITLYLVARWLRLYGSELFSLNWTVLLGVWFFLTLSTTVLAFYMGWINVPYTPLYSYNSPLVVLASVSVLLSFKKFKFSSGVINTIAASAFSVYLLHCHPAILDSYYCAFFISLFNSYNYVCYLLLSVVTIICIYVCSVLIDQIRLILWSFANKVITK